MRQRAFHSLGILQVVSHSIRVCRIRATIAIIRTGNGRNRESVADHFSFPSECSGISIHSERQRSWEISPNFVPPSSKNGFRGGGFIHRVLVKREHGFSDCEKDDPERLFTDAMRLCFYRANVLKSQKLGLCTRRTPDDRFVRKSVQTLLSEGELGISASLP